MISKIGIDFGTTNSTVSYLIKNSAGEDELHSFRTKAMHDMDYIPSVVAYIANTVIIGEAAKKHVLKNNIETHGNFKLKLRDNFEQKCNSSDKTHAQVAKDYINELLKMYIDKMSVGIPKSEKIKTDKNGKLKIEKIVMTIPAAWYGKHKIMNNIASIYNELGYPKCVLKSEPEAAAAFFCWGYQKQHGNSYDGDILVIDYGGGTLDVVLCRVRKGNQIDILERPANLDLEGCAGVAYDQAVVKRLIQRLTEEKKITKTLSPNRKNMMYQEFENHKIGLEDIISRDMSSYINNPLAVEDAPFTITYNENGDTVNVTYEDLKICFDEICAPKIDAAISEVKSKFGYHKVDANNRERFKIMLVGGFSNFISVKLKAGEHFGAGALDDSDFFKMPDCFTGRDRTLAISKGAALIANQRIRIYDTCKHSYGFAFTFIGENDQLIEGYETVIKKATKVDEVADCKYSDKIIRAMRGSSKINIFMNDNPDEDSSRKFFTLDNSTGDLFPTSDGGIYQIGISLESCLTPTVHVRDCNDHSKKKDKTVDEMRPKEDS